MTEEADFRFSGMHTLVVGGSSEAGKAALRAIRAEEKDAKVIATTSREHSDELEGYDRVITGISMAEPEAAEKLAAHLAGVNLRRIFFTPAFGPIGFPVSETKESQVKEANAFCLLPMIRLSELLNAEQTIGFSAFYWLPHLQAFYGSLAFSKRDMEMLALENPRKFSIIRGGTFLSKATRGISVLLQRGLRNSQSPALLELGEDWKKSGLKFQEYFFEFARRHEREHWGAKFEVPHRLTDGADLTRAIRRLWHKHEPIINVIGDWIWEDDSLPPMNSFLQEKYLWTFR